MQTNQGTGMMKTFNFITVFVLLAVCVTKSPFGELLENPPEKQINILAFLPSDGNGHFFGFKPLLEKLVTRGHNVTLVSPYELDNVKQSYQYIKVEKSPPDVDTFKVADYLSNIISTPLNLWWYGPYISEMSLNKSSVMDFIKNDQSSFDLVMFENFYHECFAVIGHKYNAHMIQMLPFAASERVLHWQQNYLDPAFIPDLTKVFGTTLTEQISNTVTTFLYSVIDKMIYLPHHRSIADKYFVYPGHEKRPELTEILRNITLTLVNRHPVVGIPIPQVGSYLNVAGMNCLPAKQLPEDLQQIMDNSRQGVVYFSLGSIMKTSKISKDFVLLLLSELSKIEHTVLWKWDSDDLPKLPKNVVTRKWFPQNDVLGHPNCKLFITHGGVHSTMESVYHGVPMLAIPVSGDKLGNSLRGQYHKMAIQVPYFGLTHKVFGTTLHKILRNDSYLRSSKLMSKLFKRNPLPPLEFAVYSVEYAYKYGSIQNGVLSVRRNRTEFEKLNVVHWRTLEIHSNSPDLYWFQYLFLDFLIVILCIFIIFFWLLKKIIIYIYYLYNRIYRELKNE